MSLIKSSSEFNQFAQANLLFQSIVNCVELLVSQEYCRQHHFLHVCLSIAVSTHYNLMFTCKLESYVNKITLSLSALDISYLIVATFVFNYFLMRADKDQQSFDSFFFLLFFQNKNNNLFFQLKKDQAKPQFTNDLFKIMLIINNMIILFYFK